jgi:hypothetical protein
MHEASLRKDLILEGVTGIVEGLNPTLIRMKLDAYNPLPAAKKSKRSKTADAPAAPGARAKREASPEVSSAGA